MKFTGLEKAGLISKIPVDRKRVKQSLDLAKRDLNTAKSIIRDNPDWAFSVAYNSML